MKTPRMGLKKEKRSYDNKTKYNARGEKKETRKKCTRYQVCHINSKILLEKAHTRVMAPSCIAPCSLKQAVSRRSRQWDGIVVNIARRVLAVLVGCAQEGVLDGRNGRQARSAPIAVDFCVSIFAVVLSVFLFLTPATETKEKILMFSTYDLALIYALSSAVA